MLEHDMNAPGRTRRHDIDWLRVLAMLAVFLFHCARYFNNEDWHVKNGQSSVVMSVFVGVLVQWIMPLFFILSAVGSFYALSHRGNGAYVAERFKRLFIPLVFGMLVLIPPQVYIERASHSQFSGSFWQFLPHYFDGWYGFGGNFAWMGLHLWYLEVLFVFSLLALPLFRLLRKEAVQRFISRASLFFEKPGAIFLLAIPLALMELLVNTQPQGWGRRDFGGWSVLTYLVFFILGYVVACEPQLQKSIQRHRIAALALGITTTIFGYFLVKAGISSREFWVAFLRAFNSWFWLTAILGFGGRYLTFNNRLLKYANEAVLPFYILHQTVIVIMGLFIIGWNISVGAKYLFLVVVSFSIIVSIYEFAVRRLSPMRFLFGMK